MLKFIITCPGSPVIKVCRKKPFKTDFCRDDFLLKHKLKQTDVSYKVRRPKSTKRSNFFILREADNVDAVRIVPCFDFPSIFVRNHNGFRRGASNREGTTVHDGYFVTRFHAEPF